MSAQPAPLPAKATIAEAKALVEAAQAYSGEQAFEIDASAVEAIDGPVVLAIANIGQALPARGAPVAIVNPSSAFADAFADLGLQEDLSKMEIRQ
ncbi:MAG: STAS domain-containing protein [Rhodobacteraceae bacterium]|nr:STAS domain-containing protein [Paracoccaceae bacterium]